jgi:putative DNA primase/helicase
MDEDLAEPESRVNGAGAASHQQLGDGALPPLSRTPVTIRHPSLPEESELALAERFVERHEDELRYVGAWSRWLLYDGEHWQIEKTHFAFECAKRVAREAAWGKAEKEAKALASNHMAAAIVNLARADRKMAATVEQWDTDPWLLNTPAGAVDLRTGEARAPWHGDYVTKVTGTPADCGCPCPQWLAFLHRIFSGDLQLIGYVQRVLGYILTGTTNEQALFFGYGTGANGKSVLIETVSGILGGYARSAPIETFTLASGERHPTELAMLQGARLVTAVETEEGRRWAESRIKALTGGDTISARFMRQDFFSFRPQFKLLIAGNHRPGLRSVDEAIRRRFQLLPFAVTIPPAERDPDLTRRLVAEWPGILHWMIKGCLWWQEKGLAPPPAVVEATAEYLEAEDALGAWMATCCERRATSKGMASALYASWKAWAERAGESPGSQKAFSQAVDARGIDSRKTNRGREYQGIEVIETEAPGHWTDR